MTKTAPVNPAQTYGQAVEALNRGDWQQAFALSGRILSQAPGHAGVHFVAGVAAMQMQQIPQALQLLQRAVGLNPERPDYAAQFARALAAARMLREAVETADKALGSATNDPLTLDTLGVVYSQANEHLKAAKAFRRAAGQRPDVANFRFNLATSLTFIGDIAGAEAEYEACLTIDPRYWKAHLALAQLRKQERDANHIERLESTVQAASEDSAGSMYLHLALSKEYEDVGELERSFEHLVAGKSSGRQTRDYSSERDEALFEALTLTFPEPVSETTGSQNSEPIFIIGMPRSGTTLVDRILSSHSDVHSAGELQNFGAILKRASGSRTRHLLDPDTLARSRNLDWKRLGDAYVTSTRPGTGHTSHFIDKLPHNFLFAGHIARALPSARIICLRRNPMDTCLSNFRQLFAQTSPYYDYSFDLLDTGRYYLMFDQLMAHWRHVLPGRILEIDYEAIVEDQESSTRRLLDFCGLPWEEACLRFESNDAPVATASAVQVRSPIYRSALKRWQRYQQQLAPLRKLLEDGGVAIDSH
jgi:tetratricopeptide (TPR) repeat protein